MAQQQGGPTSAEFAPPPAGAAAPVPGMDGSKLDELERLSRLRSEGHLTEAEFQTAKTKLLYG